MIIAKKYKFVCFFAAHKLDQGKKPPRRIPHFVFVFLLLCFYFVFVLFFGILIKGFSLIYESPHRRNERCCSTNYRISSDLLFLPTGFQLLVVMLMGKCYHFYQKFFLGWLLYQLDNVIGFHISPK